MTSADAWLAVDGVMVRFGDRSAVDDLSLAVARGEIVAILGTSGSGKSTLLRVIAGLQPADAGRVLLDGRDLDGVAPHERGIGLMFQDHALFPHMDVAANVGFGLRMQRRPRQAVAQRVDELLELVRLPGTQRRSIRTLSGGEQQRVALARALAPEPSLLLLDEPLGGLDRMLRDDLAAELRDLFRLLDLTVVAVTHDRDEARTMADRLMILDAGRVLQAGTVADVWRAPASPRVARLLGIRDEPT